MPGYYRFRESSPLVRIGMVNCGLLVLGLVLFGLPASRGVEQVRPAKAHETSLACGTEFYAGTTTSLRCEVHSVKSITETRPLVGAKITVTLRPPDGKGKALTLFTGVTGDDGTAEPTFALPQVPAGNYLLEVSTRSTLGEEKLQRQVQIKTEAKILLVTDKPLYQPGQRIHIRALALRPFDLKPVSPTELVFEVEDGRGNKVFKRTQRTSEYGIASVDFDLADEVNMGSYQVRALMGQVQAQKTVTVKKYVLPKFKVNTTADKSFYLPKETIKAELQSDYFFGKPVAGGKIHVTASTFDIQFKTFHTWEGKTDAQGHARFTIKLPDYFIGQPLQKGNGLVKLEIKLTDTADHTETVTKTYTVSAQPIQVSVIPEGGRMVPEMENRVFVAAIYPDGTPARCAVKLWIGREAKGESVAKVNTNDAGLAEFTLKPKAAQFRSAQWEQKQLETLGGNQQIWSQKLLFDLCAEARDSKGNLARTVAEVNSEPLGENVMLRVDKAIYRGGDTLQAEIRTSAGLPTAYLDVVKNGQTMLTRWLDVKAGKAEHKLDLPAGLFGTLEIHAYQMLHSGEIIRDSRVVYVQPRNDLKIDIKADKKVYLPGENGAIQFQITDAAGKPAPAALGVIIVDEAVYALQEMQPGLEKVYFTLQEELLKPQAQAVFQPNANLGDLILQPALPAPQQQVARVLLTAVRPKPPARWEVAPVVQRRQQMDNQIVQVGWALYNYTNSMQPFMEKDKKTGAWHFRPQLLQEMTKATYLNSATLTDPLGGALDLERLAKVEPGFTVNRLAHAINAMRMYQLGWQFINYSNGRQKEWLKDSKWTFPKTILTDMTAGNKWLENCRADPWGTPYRLTRLDKKQNHGTAYSQLDFHQLLSAGPDGKFGTDDDVVWTLPMHNMIQDVQFWWLSDAARQGKHHQQFVKWRGIRYRYWGADQGLMLEKRALTRAAALQPMDLAFPEGNANGLGNDAKEVTMLSAGPVGGGGSAAPPVRVREYFPETLKWEPALITDDRGRATLVVPFADSITTWRLNASASSQAGALGGVSAPLRVFQDFFVDLDLPVSLTQNDEVSFPVAVYNYLKQPQTIRLELTKEPWFDLTDQGGLTRSLDLKPNEVTAVHFRIKANKIGFQPLQVKANGDKMSDAIKRTVEVVPDGKRIEQVASDRLSGKITQTIVIPPYALPDASGLMVKIYPGVMSQVLEGAEGILRLPGGCFEQTSSSAYPNILVVDYIKKAKIASPEVLMKAENYLNAGYQRLLTFERPGGGFDWWGSGPALIWLSAYGLQEFTDMAKVYPIDQAIIDRTQKWLLKQQDKDGTWSNIGATHNETIAQMGDPKLLLTSYVAWSLLQNGYRGPEVKKAIEYIQTHLDTAKNNAYILALAANALAGWDAKDDRTLALLKKLDGMRKAVPEWKACCFPTNGQSLTYATGDSLTVETTALTVLAMVKTGQFTSSVNQALTYLVKSKGAYGAWSTTSATILSLKALVAGMGGTPLKEPVNFTVTVNGKSAAKGQVNAENADVLQGFDLKPFLSTGDNAVRIETTGETNLMYQIVGRHYESWQRHPAPKKPALDVSVEYDRTKLSTKDLLKAKATLRYSGDIPTYMVIVDLGIPPGFTVDPGDFAELVAAKKITKFSVTARQVILYIGDVKPGDVLTYAYSLKPRFPIKAKTPATVAYEYYTPEHRATAKPVELNVEEK